MTFVNVKNMKIFSRMLQVLMFLLSVSASLSESCDSSSISSVYSSSSASCSRSHITQALAADVTCAPVPVVVSLPWPNVTGVQQMTPTHVTVSRCEGACHGLHSCVPLATEERRISVMLGKCGLSLGKCDKECAVVTVLEHTSCGCDCHIRGEQCTASGQHVFRPEVCACECRDVRAKRECLEQGRAWSEDKCQCGCPLASITGCGPGLSFDHNSTCACVPLPGLAAAGQSDKGQLSDLSDPEAGLSWEVVIIISLGSLLLILAAIVLGLLIRLTAIRRAADTKPTLVPSTLSGQYFPCADPCTDISLSRPAKKRGLGAESDSDSDRGKMLTDSSLCSDQERDAQWTDSSESLTKQQSPVSLEQAVPCLESVNLSSHLAIRCNDNCSIYSGGSFRREPSDYGYSGHQQLERRNESDYNSLMRRSEATLRRNNQDGYQSNTLRKNNTVKIVYTNGERSTELTCLMDTNSQSEAGYGGDRPMRVTANPMNNVYNM